MGRKVLRYVIETQQYLDPSEEDAYLAANPTHGLIEVIADESILSTSGAKLPKVKGYLREENGADLIELTASGSDVHISMPNIGKKSLSNKRDMTGTIPTSKDVYEVVHTFSYQGTEIEGPILKVVAVVDVDTSAGNQATLRLYNPETNEVLVSDTVTTPGKRLIHLESIENEPSQASLLEFQVKNSKKNKTTTVYNVTLLF